MDERYHELAHWLGQKKTTEREREEIQKDLELWFKRAKFAVDQGELELARAATERAKVYQEEFRKITARLIEIESELEKLREQKVVPDEAEFKAAQTRAEHAAGEFVKMGIDPKFSAIDPRFAKIRGDGASSSDLELGAPSDASEGRAVLVERPDEISDALAEADDLLDLPLDPSEDL
jgi:hypothetical protein